MDSPAMHEVQTLTRADGRWARILRALFEHGDMRFGRLFAATRKPEYLRAVDERKTNRALRSMMVAGLITWKDGVIAITGPGRTSFATLPPTPPRVEEVRGLTGAGMMFAAGLFALLAHGGHAEQGKPFPENDLVERVQRDVNTTLKYQLIRNTLDWLPYSQGGDCKTFVSVKRRLLIRAGVAPDRLTIFLQPPVTGPKPQDGHVVLVVDGKRVMDIWGDTYPLGTAKGLSRCAWCEAMVRWESDLPQDRDAPLPDFLDSQASVNLHAMASWTQDPRLPSAWSHIPVGIPEAKR